METINLDRIFPYETQGHSSKGNQLKWKQEDYWYKADHMGYEGLSEVLVSRLMRFSNIDHYVEYEPARIEYKGKVYTGCRSRSFMEEDKELVTVDHLFRQYTGLSLTQELAHITKVKERIAYFVNMVQEYTNIKDYGKHIAAILEMDAFFLNEDRHTNNIAFIYSPSTRKYQNSPHFDNGLALFSDTSSDFTLDRSVQDCYDLIQAKPFSFQFDDQVDDAEVLYGRQLKLGFNMGHVVKELGSLSLLYEDRILERVEQTMRNQMRKYQYMFS